MNKTLRIVAAVLAGVGLFIGGFFFSQVSAQSNQPGWMMGSWDDQSAPGMMGNGQFGPGMMGNGPYDDMIGMMGGQYGSGMMGNFGAAVDVEPLSIAEVETAVTNYLTTLDNDNLTIGEIMIFDNHAYAQIIDTTTETGAFEVLIDPTTQTVFPEPGPNMMWNTEYGMMNGNMMGSMMNGQSGSGMMGGGMMNGQSGSGMMGGDMMGNFGYAPDAVSNFSAEEAIVSAQEYLDTYLPGKTADEKADAFPGYYTIHVLEDGQTIGMLSVNTYSGQVFLHHWHGEFIEMAGEGHE